MKYAECNERQKKAWKNIKHAASDYIFGLLNGCFDNDEGSDEYKDYKAALDDLDGLITAVYNESLTTVYTYGGCAFGPDAESYLKDIRFCGKEFLMKVVTPSGASAGDRLPALTMAGEKGKLSWQRDNRNPSSLMSRFIPAQSVTSLAKSSPGRIVARGFRRNRKTIW